MAYLRLSRAVAATLASLAMAAMPIAAGAAPVQGATGGTTQPSAAQIEQRIQSALGGANLKWNVLVNNPHIMVLHGTSGASNLDISINCVITYNPFSIRCTINFFSSSL
ncbi:MAG TPA: hypothetical protein VHA78_00760 [Candidatus Peribacteraceae bacterium]|nr:hypothetical protein [Candidatus Peribacteraceae bacterium]